MRILKIFSILSLQFHPMEFSIIYPLKFNLHPEVKIKWILISFSLWNKGGRFGSRITVWLEGASGEHLVMTPSSNLGQLDQSAQTVSVKVLSISKCQEFTNFSMLLKVFNHLYSKKKKYIFLKFKWIFLFFSLFLLPLTPLALPL